MLEMERQEVVQELHKQARRNFIRRRVIHKGIDDLWQADLVEMGVYSKYNKGYRFILTVIDTFSKFAWAVPVKSKGSEDITNAMKSIFSLKRFPKNLQTDNGKEFYNKIFQNLMKKHNINHYSTYSIMKASIVERFNRTLKGMMWKKFSLQGNYQWIHICKDLINEYNNKKHRTIGMKPNAVNIENESSILKQAYNHPKIYKFGKLKVGDHVRISKYKHIFAKGYTPNWTTEIFKIRTLQNTNPITYLLEDYQRNPIVGGFYEHELLKTHFPNTYLIENVIKTKGHQAYVKWLGFSNQHNSWINKDELQ